MTQKEPETYDEIFAYYRHQAATRPIDANMQALIEILNGLPGIATIGCCGGHESPRRDQCPQGQWYATIEPYRCDDTGWTGLDIIRYAMAQTERRVSLDFSTGPGLRLSGKEISSSLFAALISKELRRIEVGDDT